MTISIPLIEVRNLSFSYGERLVLSDVSFSVAKGETWSVIGKNGAGKSTLIKCMAGLLAADRGSVFVNGADSARLKPRERAKTVSYVPQASGRSMAAYTVFDFVMLGRFPYQGVMAMATQADAKIVSDALRLTDVQMLGDRLLTTLSGGELQRVFLAGAVAQQSSILLLDEPATFLDPLHQQLVSDALSRIHSEFGTAIVTITHDVNTAITRFENVLALVDGGPFYAGPAKAFRTRCPEVLGEIFSIAFEQAIGKETRQTVMIPGKGAA